MITIIPLHTCAYCGKEYIKTHNRQIYCSSKCSYYGGLEKTANRVHKYRIRKKQNFGYDSVKNLGGGHLGPHRKENMAEEAVLVRKELNRFKL